MGDTSLLRCLIARPSLTQDHRGHGLDPWDGDQEHTYPVLECGILSIKLHEGILAEGGLAERVNTPLSGVDETVSKWVHF